ncbi:hypothetical protein D910_07399 [Dendroctonus ponderosae]
MGFQIYGYLCGTVAAPNVPKVYRLPASKTRSTTSGIRDISTMQKDKCLPLHYYQIASKSVSEEDQETNLNGFVSPGIHKGTKAIPS